MENSALIYGVTVVLAVLGRSVGQTIDPDWECDFSNGDCLIQQGEQDDGDWRTRSNRYYAGFNSNSGRNDKVTCIIPYTFQPSMMGSMTFKYRSRNEDGHLKVTVCKDDPIPEEFAENNWTDVDVNISCSTEVQITFTAVQNRNGDPNVRIDDIKVYETIFRTTAPTTPATTSLSTSTSTSTSSNTAPRSTTVYTTVSLSSSTEPTRHTTSPILTAGTSQQSSTVGETTRAPTPVSSTDTKTTLRGSDEERPGGPNAILISSVTSSILVLVLISIGLIFGCRHQRKSSFDGPPKTKEYVGENEYDNPAFVPTTCSESYNVDQTVTGGIMADSQDTYQEHHLTANHPPLANGVRGYLGRPVASDEEDIPEYFVVDQDNVVPVQPHATHNESDTSYQQLIPGSGTSPKTAYENSHTYTSLTINSAKPMEKELDPVHPGTPLENDDIYSHLERKSTATKLDNKDETYQGLGSVNSQLPSDNDRYGDTYSHLERKANSPKFDNEGGTSKGLDPVYPEPPLTYDDTYSHLERKATAPKADHRGETNQVLGSAQQNPPEDDDTYSHLTRKTSTTVNEFGEDYSTTHALNDETLYNSLDHGNELKTHATPSEVRQVSVDMFDEGKYGSLSPVRSTKAAKPSHRDQDNTQTDMDNVYNTLDLVDGNDTGSLDIVNDNDYGVMQEGTNKGAPKTFGIAAAVGKNIRISGSKASQSMANASENKSSLRTPYENTIPLKQEVSQPGYSDALCVNDGDIVEHAGSDRLYQNLGLADSGRPDRQVDHNGSYHAGKKNIAAAHDPIYSEDVYSELN